VLFNFLIRSTLAVLAFAVGFKATDWYFRREIIPYPSEFFGVLTGLAFASWTLAVFSLTKSGSTKLTTKRRIR